MKLVLAVAAPTAYCTPPSMQKDLVPPHITSQECTTAAQGLQDCPQWYVFLISLQLGTFTLHARHTFHSLLHVSPSVAL